MNGFLRRCGHRLCVLLLGVAFLAGCERPHPLADSLSDYRERLARVLRSDLPPLPEPVIVAFPSQRALTLPLEQPTIGLLDFLALLDCELANLVARRNSGLGKVQTASQSWLHERDFVRLGWACVGQLREEGEESLANDLVTVLMVKQRQMARVAWNASWAGPEYQQVMATKPASPTTDFSRFEGDARATALVDLLRWSRSAGPDGEPAEDIRAALEPANRALLGSPTPGEVLYAMEASTATLRSLTAAIEARLAARPLCPTGRATEQARILRNVLVQIFVGRVQPHLAGLRRLHQRWVPVLTEQWTALSLQDGDIARLTLREDWGAYYGRYIRQGEGSLWNDFLEAQQGHARVWTALLEDCGLRPGGRFDADQLAVAGVGQQVDAP